jgi:hypothetical protein
MAECGMNHPDDSSSQIMDYKKVEGILRRLLVMLEGVSLHHLRTHPSGHATASLRIACPASIARLACFATNCNVGMYVWGDSRGTTEESWSLPERVYYEIRSGSEKMTDMPYSIEFFCGELVRDLCARGLLSADEADCLFSELNL